MGKSQKVSDSQDFVYKTGKEAGIVSIKAHSVYKTPAEFLPVKTHIAVYSHLEVFILQKYLVKSENLSPRLTAWSVGEINTLSIKQRKEKIEPGQGRC